MSQDLLDAARAALASGHKGAARTMLMQLARDPAGARNGEVWHLLAQVLDDPAQRADCAQRAAKLSYVPPVPASGQAASPPAARPPQPATPAPAQPAPVTGQTVPLSSLPAGPDPLMLQQLGQAEVDIRQLEPQLHRVAQQLTWNVPKKQRAAYVAEHERLYNTLHNTYKHANMLRAQLGMPPLVPHPHDSTIAPGSPATGPAKAKGFSAGGLILAIVVACAFVGWAARDGRSSSPTTRTTTTSSSSVTVTYRVTGVGTRTADVTYTNAQGGTEQKKVVLPWQSSFSVPGSTRLFLYLSTQNNGSSGDISCDILLDGQAYKHSTSSGGYTIATCSQ